MATSQGKAANEGPCGLAWQFSARNGTRRDGRPQVKEPIIEVEPANENSASESEKTEDGARIDSGRRVASGGEWTLTPLATVPYSVRLQNVYLAVTLLRE